MDRALVMQIVRSHAEVLAALQFDAGHFHESPTYQVLVEL